MRAEQGSLTGGLPYVAVGSGPPLVVLGGLSAEHAPASRMERWPPLRTFGRPFQRAFRVHLVNRRAGPLPRTTMADLAAHVAVAVRADLPAPVRLVGTSTGGSIALQTAIDHPDVVDRLVVRSSACRLSEAGRTGQRLLAEHTLAGRHRAAWPALAPMLATGRAGRVAFAGLLWAFGPLSAPDDPNDMVATIRAEDAFDAEAELGGIAAPTLVIGGEHDGFYSPELFAATARGIPGAHLLLRPRGTHISVLRDHESLFGTNRMIAEAIADGLGTNATVTLVDAEAAPSTIDDQIDLLVVGGPNHQFGLPRPATRAEAATERDGARPQAERGLREWLDDVRLSRTGQPAAVWDTRMASPRILDTVDHSARTITKQLRRAGARLVTDAEHFYSADGKGALVEGEHERARAWGAQLAGSR